MIWSATGYVYEMRIPTPRGAFTETLFRTLQAGDVRPAQSMAGSARPDDAALALWTLHQLHYRGVEGVDDAAEWDPDVLRLRQRLEHDLERRLRARHTPTHTGSFVDTALAWIDAQDGRSLAAHVHRHADRAQVLDLLRVRSIYHLKESDAVAWLVPRLGVRAKAALMELQFDEYGDGDPNRLHHELFARGLAASGLDPSYEAHIDVAPMAVLEQNNAVSMFGLQRRLRAAALGHLAAFEATSSLPCRRMARGLRRLGLPDELIAYYDEHVVADAVHEELVVRSICAAFLADDPHEEPELWFGAWTCLDLENRVATAMFTRWGIDQDESRTTAGAA